jgi:hypothetical protein
MDLLEKFAPKKKKNLGINQCGEKGGGGVLHTRRICGFENLESSVSGI